MKIEQEHKDYNKFLKRHGLPEMSLEKFIRYKSGKLKKTRKKKPLNTSYLGGFPPKEKIYDTKDMKYTTAHPGSKVYTGTLVRGIATMHKSNAVPVINQEQAVEISQMRRN